MFSRDFVVLRRRKKQGPFTLLCSASVRTDIVPEDRSIVRYAWCSLCKYSVYYPWTVTKDTLVTVASNVNKYFGHFKCFE